MKFSAIAGVLFAASTAWGLSTKGIQNLLHRRLPAHANDFQFWLVNVKTNDTTNDHYTVTTTKKGEILVEGNSLSALSSGLHRYLTDVAGVDIFWYIGSRLDQAPRTLPKLTDVLEGTSIVPWRYYFNTVTFSYTSAFWTWEDWEDQLDWMALHGINFPLAWAGQEKVLVEVLQELGLTDEEINSYLSGPAFQAWNRFGNIQGSWGGSLPTDWIKKQYILGQQIVGRMVELGMTPIFPAFTGFVPRNISRVLPNATTVTGGSWNKFPEIYTNDVFLEPSDDNYALLQKSFISTMQRDFGQVTKYYTLDQYNENNPYSGDTEYLRNISRYTWESLKEADSEAVWVMQGWLFSYSASFWTDNRIEAYLSGVEDNSDMMILDLFSESSPQWQRTNSYYGKPWVWCQLHDYGGNMGMYGQIQNITQNPIAALANSSSLQGFGLTMEGQEGNQIIYDLLLAQAWSSDPIDTETYFKNWVTTRYAGAKSIPKGLYTAWEAMRTTVYNNTDPNISTAVTKSIFELIPSISGLTGRTGQQGTLVTYDPAVLVDVWKLFYQAAQSEKSLWNNPGFQYDIVDITRQVLSNAFIPAYNNLVSVYTGNSPTAANINAAGKALITILQAIDNVLSTNKNFMLSTWISKARSWAPSSAIADFYEYNARNQITLWGPNGEISDYASKSWGGLVSSYYIPRWEMFIGYLNSTAYASYNNSAFTAELLTWELEWNNETSRSTYSKPGNLKKVLTEVATLLSIAI
ncbi:putative alpha-N-acetylglucosaminidase [Aspergillus pseudoustus]|uniref:Alpha-N-acetylglucosaminidase n=1 Tax=Aspergillus pseudoustus TaxID=1810923 RepID=A0ABR4IQX8_9EURO